MRNAVIHISTSGPALLIHVAIEKVLLHINTVAFERYFRHQGLSLVDQKYGFFSISEFANEPKCGNPRFKWLPFLNIEII